MCVFRGLPLPAREAGNIHNEEANGAVIAGLVLRGKRDSRARYDSATGLKVAQYFLSLPSRNP